MFGCFRRSDAADPEIYVRAVELVLAHYSPEVIKAVTDPYGGLPSRKNEQGWSGLPDVADVKEACEAEAVRQERLAKYAAMPRTKWQRLPAPPEEPGARANVFVAAGHPRYEALCERAAKESPAWSRYGMGPSGDVTGIWVPLGWTDGWRRGYA